MSKYFIIKPLIENSTFKEIMQLPYELLVAHLRWPGVAFAYSTYSDSNFSRQRYTKSTVLDMVSEPEHTTTFAERNSEQVKQILNRSFFLNKETFIATLIQSGRRHSARNQPMCASHLLSMALILFYLRITCIGRKTFSSLYKLFRK